MYLVRMFWISEIFSIGWDSVLDRYDIYVMTSDFRPGTEYNDGISKF